MSKPSTTLYVTNLNDKIKKEDLRRQLYNMFSLYGKILDVVHTRNPKVRATAFVVFRDLASSTAALRALDGEGFFGKTLRVQYAKSTSHATIAHEEGPEAMFAIKMGLAEDPNEAAKTNGAGSRVTVSNAQRTLMGENAATSNRKRRADDVEENDSDEDGEGGQRDGARQSKKAATAGNNARQEQQQEAEEDEEEMAMSEGE